MALPETTLLSVALDSAEALKGLSGAARAAQRRIDILVEVDVGLGRVGLAKPTDVVRLAAQATQLDGVRFRGILFYPGHIRVPGGEQDAQLSQVASVLDRVLNALHLHGLPPQTVSGGSTPTLWNSHRIPGTTELRAGSCIFNDREGLSLGVAELEDVAYTVLATVVSVAVPGQAVVDAGSKALSKEIRLQDGSYGVVFDRPDIRVSSLSEEHGVLDLSGTDWRPRVGDAVRIIPNHVCVSVNLQDHVLVQDGASWEICPLEARGRGPFSASNVGPGV
jgi:D-serine deaminase-like pyridoxal phosphate-dependent protein